MLFFFLQFFWYDYFFLFLFYLCVSPSLFLRCFFFFEGVFFQVMFEKNLQCRNTTFFFFFLSDDHQCDWRDALPCPELRQHSSCYGSHGQEMNFVHGIWEFSLFFSPQFDFIAHSGAGRAVLLLSCNSYYYRTSRTRNIFRFLFRSVYTEAYWSRSLCLRCFSKLHTWLPARVFRTVNPG